MRKQISSYLFFYTLLINICLFAQNPPIIAPPNPSVPTRDIVNTSFEDPNLNLAGSFGFFEAANGSGSPKFVGWKSTHPTDGTNDHPIEAWGIGFTGVNPPLGGDSQFVELNSFQESALYQDVCLTAGEVITWSAHHRGRSSAVQADTAEFFISDTSNWSSGTVLYSGPKLYSSIMYTSNNASITNGISIGGGWAKHSGNWLCISSGVYRIAFQSLFGSGGSSQGNFLDLISINSNPHVMFLPTNISNNVNISQIEEDTTYYLTIAVSGTLQSPATFNISPGNSSTLSTSDFTIGSPLASGNGGSVDPGVFVAISGNAITVTLPAKSYDINNPNDYISIPLLVADSIFEEDEDIVFEITNLSGGGISGQYELITGSGCMTNSQSSVQLKVIDNDLYQAITIPNVFTPNGDGLNDLFEIKSSGIKNYDLKIYNRWGIEVFYSNDAAKHWDGRTNSGSLATDGTYYYVLKTSTLKDSEETFKGFLTLIR